VEVKKGMIGCGTKKSRVDRCIGDTHDEEIKMTIFEWLS
jgi:hypothetical protein